MESSKDITNIDDDSPGMEGKFVKIILWIIGIYLAIAVLVTLTTGWHGVVVFLKGPILAIQGIISGITKYIGKFRK